MDEQETRENERTAKMQTTPWREVEEELLTRDEVVEIERDVEVTVRDMNVGEASAVGAPEEPSGGTKR